MLSLEGYSDIFNGAMRSTQEVQNYTTELSQMNMSVQEAVQTPICELSSAEIEQAGRMMRRNPALVATQSRKNFDPMILDSNVLSTIDKNSTG